jgi:hypothetical protein
MGSATRFAPSITQANGAVRRVPLPLESRRRATLPRLDYTDSFLIATDRVHELTAEQWARGMLEAAPQWWQHALPRGWRILGLDHGPARSDDFVLGWPVKHCTDDVMLLSAAGHRGLSAELLVERRTDGLLFATFVHQHNWAAKLEWAAIAAPHRHVVTYLLKHASQVLDS